jgi:hypothetical protein
MVQVLDAPDRARDGGPELSDVTRFSRANDALAQNMPQAVKGAGFAKIRGVKPLDDDDPEVFRLAFAATKSLRESVHKSFKNPKKVVKGLNPNFLGQFNSFMAAMDAPGAGNSAWMSNLFQQVEQALSDLGKNVNLTVPLTATTQGLVPYDLVNPSRLIYPVYSPFRNKLPRVAGQGTSRRVNAITGISGSKTGGGTGGGSGLVVDISLADVPNSSMQMPGGTFPVNMPVTGLQSAVAVNIPYQFFGMSEALSWLAQFAGQGYEDISALANLILLQEFMLNEEFQMIAGTNVAIVAPTTAVTLTTRTAGTGETVLPVGTHFWVVVTAANESGETVMNSVSADGGAINGTSQVIDVTLPQNLPAGAEWWNVYANNTSVGAPARTLLYRVYAGLGGNKLTLQGPTVPNAVSATSPNPPVADSGTSGTNRMLGTSPRLPARSRPEPATTRPASAGRRGTSSPTWVPTCRSRH